MDKLLKQYTIKEIAERTRISPIILSKLLDGEFDKVNIIKLKGFVKILENEYKHIDFTELKEQISEFDNKKDTPKIEKKEVLEEVSNGSGKAYFLVFLLLILIAGSVYYLKKDNNKNINIKVPKTEINNSKILKQDIILEKNISKEENKTVEMNTSLKTEVKKIDVNNTLAIVPVQKVWFRVYNLDDNSSKQFLTSNEIDLNGSKKLFIKFGHGMVKFYYHNNVIFPDTVKRVRLIVENGEMNVTKKRLKDFK